MATVSARSRRWAGNGAFYVGLSVIGAAAVLNVAYDRLSWIGPEVMPQFLSHMYDTSGKTSVTIAFVALGLSIMLLGFAFPRTDNPPAETDPQPAGPGVVYYAVDEGSNASGLTPSGRVVLRTQQYMRKKSGPSN